jgi:hypothetical protein
MYWRSLLRIRCRAHRRFGHTGGFRETGKRPTAVVPPVTDATLLGAQREQGCRQTMPLCLGPTLLCLVEHRRAQDIVQIEQCDAMDTAQVEGSRDHDPTQPARKGGRFFEVSQPPEGAQVSLLDRVLGPRGIA